MRFGFSRSESAVENWFAGIWLASHVFETGAGKMCVDVGASRPPTPGGLSSGSGDVAGLLIVARPTPLACCQSSEKNPFSCVAGTPTGGGAITPTPGIVPSGPGIVAPIVPPDCVPAVRLSPTPTMLSFCTGAALRRRCRPAARR